MKLISQLIREMYPELKCVTDECENMTTLHLCDDCTEEQLSSYENHLERQAEER